MSGNLWAIIQKHLDDYGPKEAEFARRIGASSQTVNSWKNRGIHKPIEKKWLLAISDVTRTPYDVVLDAMLRDTGYLPKEAIPSGAPIDDELEAGLTKAERRQIEKARKEFRDGTG